MTETLHQNVNDQAGAIEWVSSNEPNALPSFQSIDNHGVICRLQQFAYRRQSSAEITGPGADLLVYEDGASDEILDQAVPRRPILKVIAHGAAVLTARSAVANTFVAVAEHRFIENNWEKTPASVTYLNHEYDPTLHDEVFFFFPGLGDIHGKAEAQELLDHGELAADIPMALITMSHQRTTKQEIVDQIKEKLGDRPPKRVSMFGRSFGGPFGLSVLAEVCDDLNIMLDRFVLCSSPDDISHGNFGRWGAALDKWLPDWDWLDLDAKAIASFATQIQEHGFLDVIDNVERARHVVETGESPVGLRSDTHLLRTNSIHQKSTLERLARVTKPGFTSGKYVASHRPGSDHTVRDRASFAGFKREFDKLDIEFAWLGAPFIGHAQMKPSTLVLRPWFKKTNRPNSRILAAK